jgi:hypothetical protein
MREVVAFQRRLCSRAFLSALVAALLLGILGEEATGRGILLGSVFSIINFVLLGKFIPLALGKSRKRAGFVSLISILTRYALLAVPLIVGLKSTFFNFDGVVIGIFSIQIITLVTSACFRLD